MNFELTLGVEKKIADPLEEKVRKVRNGSHRLFDRGCVSGSVFFTFLPSRRLVIL